VLTKKENPAEYILEVIGAGTSKKKSVDAEIDWPEIWKKSKEYSAVHEELEKLAIDTSNADQKKASTYLSSCHFW
jgi:hypothetical protein